MDGAIQFKSSRMDKAFHGAGLILAGYWFWSADIPFSLRLVAIFVLGACAVYYGTRSSRNLIGNYRLGSTGRIKSVANNPLEESINYQINLRQRLPWCLDVQLKCRSDSRRQLIWIDSLTPEDWRSFRVFLTEECQQSR